MRTTRLLWGGIALFVALGLAVELGLKPKGTTWFVKGIDDVTRLFADVTMIELPREGDRPKLRIYRRDTLTGSRHPILVFIHGGGWVNGSVLTYDTVTRGLTGRLEGFVVVSVDYLLSPDVKFPVAVLDCTAAVRWVAQHANDYGGDAGRVAIGGDSAGGNLAAATLLALLLEEAAPHALPFAPLWPPPEGSKPPLKLCASWLVYPVLDAGMSSETYRTYADGPGTLTADKMAYFWSAYLDTGLHAWNALAAPGLAAGGAVLARAPPTLVQTAELDVLRAEGEDYAEALAKSGARARWLRYGGETHAFMFRLWTPEGLDLDQPAWREAVAFLQGECGSKSLL